MKNFLVIGSMNAVTYRDTFVHIKNNELWLGVNSIKKFQYEDEFLHLETYIGTLICGMLKDRISYH